MTFHTTRRSILCSGVTALGVGLVGCTGSEEDTQTYRRTTRTTKSETTTPSTETAKETGSETTKETSSDYMLTGPNGRRPISGTWPMFQYDAGRLGRSPASSPPQANVSRYWRISPTDSTHPFTSPPVVGDGAVYVGRKTRMESFEPATGARRWSAETDGTGEIRFSPAVTGETVIACTYDTVFAVDVANGAVQWRQSTQIGGLSAPAVSDGTVFVSEGTSRKAEGRLYAFDAEDGTERWTFDFDGDNRSAPAVAEGLACVADTGGTVYAVAVEDGSEQWRFDATGEGYTTPVSSDGSVFFADGSGIVYRLDRSDGTVSWEGNGTSPRFHAAPAIGSDAVYVGGREGIVALSKATGTEQWTHQIESDGATSCALADDVVYVGTGSGAVLGLRAETGDERWQFQVREVQREDVVHRGVSDGIAVVNGGVFVTSEGGDVYALSGSEE